MRILLFTILLLLSAPRSLADVINRLIGTWVSPDGKTKQRFERSFEGEWIDNKLWFMRAQGWK